MALTVLINLMLKTIHWAIDPLFLFFFLLRWRPEGLKAKHYSNMVSFPVHMHNLHQPILLEYVA